MRRAQDTIVHDQAAGPVPVDLPGEAAVLVPTPVADTVPDPEPAPVEEAEVAPAEPITTRRRSGGKE